MRFGSSGSARRAGAGSAFLRAGGVTAGAFGPHGHVGASATLVGATPLETAGPAGNGRLRRRSSSLRAVGDQIAVGILREKRAIAGGGVGEARRLPRHHAALAIEPFARDRPERRALVIGDESLIGFVGAIGHDQIVGFRRRLAAQCRAPLIDTALACDGFRDVAGRGEKAEVVGQ